MSIVRVQDTGKARGSNVSSLAVSFGVLPAVGNFLAWEVGGTNNRNIAATDFSDNQSGNTYLLAVTAANGNGRAGIGYCESIVGSAGTFTCTRTPPASDYFAMMLVEWSGMATASTLDKTASSVNASGTYVSGTTAATVQNDELVVAVINGSTFGTVTFTKDAAYTEDVQETNGGTYTTMEGSYQILSATGAQTSTWTSDTGVANSGTIATFKAAAVAGGQPFIKRFGGVRFAAASGQGVW